MNFNGCRGFGIAVNQGGPENLPVAIGLFFKPEDSAFLRHGFRQHKAVDRQQVEKHHSAQEPGKPSFHGEPPQIGYGWGTIGPGQPV